MGNGQSTSLIPYYDIRISTQTCPAANISVYINSYMINKEKIFLYQIDIRSEIYSGSRLNIN